MNQALADLIFPNITKTIVDYEMQYPERNLKEGAIVTRFAPSPTGFVHMGSLLAAFVAKKYAEQTDGVFFLRIEDTDQKRSVENGIDGIIQDLKAFDITINEGRISETEELGAYGPYLQSEREAIYKAFAKHLILNGLAYPCFLTEEEIEETRKRQEICKERIGIYGPYAKYRNLPADEAYQKIQNGEAYIIRLKSPGDFNRKVVLNDVIRGKIEFPENDLDLVIIKQDGLPTYHFAHFVDDYLMRTTHIIRGDEWISSAPIHLQLFQVFGVKPPKYAHLAPIMKLDNGSRRKLSKRKDPEAAVSYYHEQGIPTEAVLLYLMTIANSNFEEWMNSNPSADYHDFKLEFKKMSVSGALFDLEKLENISRNYISLLSAEEVYDRALTHALEFNSEFAKLLKKYKDKTIQFFNIEREQKKPRKDFVSFGTLKDQTWYLYDELFSGHEYHLGKINDKDKIKEMMTLYLNDYYDESDDESTWFDKMKQFGESYGYCSNMKDYKMNPENYPGSIVDISTLVRVIATTLDQTPNLYQIIQLLGKDGMKKRLEIFLNQ